MISYKMGFPAIKETEEIVERTMLARIPRHIRGAKRLEYRLLGSPSSLAYPLEMETRPTPYAKVVTAAQIG